ncbi:MAG: metal ABC transporter ATP-binding protein [Pseudomonadota bacterium]
MLSPTQSLTLATKDGETVSAAAPVDAALAVSGLTVAYGERAVVFSLDTVFPTGCMAAIVGPNGAGKSSFLKAVLGIVPKLSGTVSAFGAPIETMGHRIAYVPQRASVDWDFPTRVIDVVMMGLYRELGLLVRIRGEHKRRAFDCLDRVGMKDFADRQIGQLSGGQQQRVFLARALAQDADLFLLDEPFAGVDAATERAIIGVLSELKTAGKTVIAVHHDLSTVHDYFDHALLLNVRKVADGPVETALTPETLQAAYGGRLATAQLAPQPAAQPEPQSSAAG